MRLLLASCEDIASLNIRDRLLESVHWQEVGSFRGLPVHRRGEDLMVTIEKSHLFSDDLNNDVSNVLGFEFSSVLFLSRHKAASGIPTLTVHPIGNYGKADYGGRSGELVPADPGMMTALLLQLSTKAKGLPFQISFETTHHGPWLVIPTTFIEIGSNEETWGHQGAAQAIAAAIIEATPLHDPVAIGIGGGHYAPRFSEVCQSKRICFGHMLPNYAIEDVDDDMARDRLQRAAQASRAEMVYLHKKSMSRSRADRLKEIANSLGLNVVDSKELEDR